MNSPYPLTKFMLFISMHKIEGRYWKYCDEILGQNTKDATFYYSFYLSSEELISTGQSANVFYSFRLCQGLILNVTFQGKYFWKNNLLQRKNLLISQELFCGFCHFWHYFRDKCYRFNESDAL